MGFDIKDFLNEESKKEIKSDWKPVKISVHKLRPAAGKENFYHMYDKEIEDTARTIELVGIQQYPVVKPIPGTDEYEVIAGHKRRLAVLKLISEGKTEYEMIPCKIESTEDNIKNRLILIFTNSTQRERTDYEKMLEVKEVRALLEEWQKDNKLPGRLQNTIAKILGTSKTKVGTLEHIAGKLIEPFKNEFACGKISTSTANEIAGLNEPAQQALYETYKETGQITAKDAKAVKEPETAPETPAEPPKTPQTEETPKEQKNTECEARDESQAQLLKSDTKLVCSQTPQDTTDHKSLIINGKINMNKEYDGTNITYFMDAIIHSNLFDTKFWNGWKENTYSKTEYIADYEGLNATFVFDRTAEQCTAALTGKGLEIVQITTGKYSLLTYKDLADLIDVMIYTKVLNLAEIESDLTYWANRTVKELSSFSNYLTESEIYILQDIMMKCKERAAEI